MMMMMMMILPLLLLLLLLTLLLILILILLLLIIVVISPCTPRALRGAENHAHACIIRKGDATVGNPHRAQISEFELFEIILLLEFDKQFPVEQFEATVSQSAVPSPPLKNTHVAYGCLDGWVGGLGGRLDGWMDGWRDGWMDG